MTSSTGALELLQRDVERVDRFEIEVVGRLVEHEHVRLLQHDAAEEQPRGLAARQRVGRLQAFFAAEQHLAEQAVDVLRAASGSNWCSHSTAVMPLLDRAGVVLREVADRDLVAPAHRARVEVAGRRHARRVGEQRLEQRRLADAVAADEHDLLAAVDDGAEASRRPAGRRTPSLTPLNSSATGPTAGSSRT